MKKSGLSMPISAGLNPSDEVNGSIYRATNSQVGAFPKKNGYALQAFCLATTDFPAKWNQMDNLWTKEQIEALEQAGCKFTPGGSHISRTIMLTELKQVLDAVPSGSPPDTYRSAILTLNVLGKGTESTRQKSLRHLRELYGLDEATPIFGLLRKLHASDAAILPLLAIQVAWARDPLLRATSPPIMDASDGERVETASLAQALEAAFPNQYSELNRNKVARNAASSWTQSRHLAGRAKKTRQRVKPTAVAITMALFLGDTAGYHGAAVFSNPWCRLLDLNPDRAKAMGFEAHRAGLLNLRAVGEVVELSFPLLAEFQGQPS